MTPQYNQMTEADRLMALEGAAFDRAFVAQMMKDNEEALEELHNGPL